MHNDKNLRRFQMLATIAMLSIKADREHIPEKESILVGSKFGSKNLVVFLHSNESMFEPEIRTFHR